MSVTGFLVNGQVQKYDYESLDNLPEDTGAGSFPVIYNVTTASEITQALNKNQIPVLKDPTTGSLYYLNSSAELNGNRIYIFVSNQGDRMRQVEVVGNTWGSFSDTILALNTSPTFQGIPKAPTAPTGTNNTQLATTAFVHQEIMYGALSENLKQALLQIASKVAYIDTDGQTYYDDLENALYPHDLLGIEATFTQGSAIIYDTDSLNDLKQYLTVVATYSGGDTETLSDTDYTLSGNLLSGVSEIIVEYEGFTDTFDVVVTHRAGYYTIVNNLTGCTTNNSATSIQENTTYTATITASVGYTLSGATATITMGGNILTGVFSNGTISIPSVTGDLVITVVASAITVSSISAVYTQSGTVYDTDTLDSLKDDLVVTAVYSDSSTQTVAAEDYTLSGILTEGTSTITVSYGGQITTFDVTVTAASLLPDAYQQVAYIENPGGAYINTTVNFPQKFEAYVKSQTSSAPTGKAKIVLGGKGYWNYGLVTYSTTSLYVGAFCGNNNTFVQLTDLYDSPAETTVTVDTVNNTVVFDATNASANASKTGASIGDITSVAIRVFWYGDATQQFVGQIYEVSVKNTETNAEVLHLYPCYRKADSKAGMYDTVNNEFYASATSTDFVKGADV